ncbi:ENT domain-containing protein [Meloidogyne graminicola]|uniref:ENT domain-containing protein n=1 Tax=Meloidogyne graminicola TaxID=189291 RepID=A0A8S9ZN93_9BILA|nr:ENT domain-containing protein [Meloidogyne graminicola]
MRPTTSAVQELSSNTLDEADLSEEDAKYLLKALEKQAFDYVLYAFRAQGPLTKYKELILDHLKSALFITDQEFSLNLRIAANNPHLNGIVKKLNPSYDNFSEWLAAGLDLTGAEMANSRRLQLNNSNPSLADHSGQILREIHRHNRNLSRESIAASEAIAELYHLPKRPFMPERLRKLLRDTEADGIVECTEVKKEKTSEVIPPINTKDEQNEPKPIKKRNVGRPRKYPRKEETNVEQTKPQQGKEEIQKQEQTQTNNNNFNNCFIKGKMWGKRRPNRWLDLNIAMEEEARSSSIIPITSSNKNITTLNKCLPYVQPSTSNNCSTEAMENLADLALAQMAEFPLISSSLSIPLKKSFTNSTHLFINHQKSTNESAPKIGHKIVENDCNSEQVATTVDCTSQVNVCARTRPFVFEKEISQQCSKKAETQGNYRSSSSPLPSHNF